MAGGIRWDEEAEVVVVGYGGAGAVTAITAHDAGAKVLIIEKQPADTPNRTRHTPSTRLCGGAWLCPKDADATVLYLKAMTTIANETLDAEREEMLSVFARYLVEGTDWVRSMGIATGDESSLSGTTKGYLGPKWEVRGQQFSNADFPKLPGAECATLSFAAVAGKYRQGAAFFKGLSDAVEKRGIPVMWDTPARHLITKGGAVCGVVAVVGGREIAIRARRAVVRTCGGFEFNPWMKENYLRVNPAEFTGSPACTGEGITMAMEIGASLWHMNSADWRVVMKFPGHPCGFATQLHETASIFVDRFGRRFTNERFNLHAFGYELINYDGHLACYPKVPSYWVFDEKRRALAPIASLHGVCNPPGGVTGDIFYNWSADNLQEIDRGWIIRASTVEDLANKIKNDPDNGGLMSVSTLEATMRRYNELCRKGEDTDFGKDRTWLQPLVDPPYYAVKLWPGGPNTEGGPRRNIRGQVLRVDGASVPRLYSAGELGSVWGMLYQAGGMLGECIAFGRIAGANAAAERAIR